MTIEKLLTAGVMFGGFVVALFVASMVLPGSMQQGVALRDGTRRTYKLNGLLIFLLTYLFVGLATWQRWFSLSIVYHHFWELLVVVNLFAFAMTGLLYVLGRKHADGVWRGLFYGAELNPTWFGVDLKMFSYRPSLIGLGLIDLSFAFAQLEKYGTIYPSMMLFQVFVFIYLFNYFQFEYGMLHTWDIIAEKFGWMLVWGDYVLVPFFYSIAAWSLIDKTSDLSWSVIIGLSAMFLVGFALFRGSNQQKHRYKVNPQARIWGKPAESIDGKLLISGFWGIGRKLNYTGEILIYWAWTLTSGWTHFSAYLLPLWLTCLLTHRAWRDEQRCSEKYGDLWHAYCRRARFRMFPFLY